MALFDIARFSTQRDANGALSIIIQLDGPANETLPLTIQNTEDFLVYTAILNGPNPVFDSITKSVRNFNAPTRQNNFVRGGNLDGIDDIPPQPFDPDINF